MNRPSEPTVEDDAAPSDSQDHEPREHEAASLVRRGVLAENKDGGLYRLLVETVRDYAIFALDPDGYIISWNAGAERLKGYMASDIIGRHFSIFYPPERIAEGFPQHELQVAQAVGRFEDEGWRLRKDGSRFWANVVITALRDPSGALVGFAKVTRDLTDRRLQEEQLRESEERFRVLVQGVRDYAIFMLDPSGRIASWNEGAQRIKGYSAEEIVGRHFSLFYPADQIAANKPQHELAIATREGKYEEEGWRVRKDGSLFWASVLISALRDPHGTLIGYAKVTRDLTERRAAQERAIADARRIAEVESANRTRSEFLASLSHELRTPINGTLGYLDLIETGIGGEASEQHREFLGRIRRSQEHLLRIINDLLNYSRIEAGQVEYARAPVPLGEVVAVVLPMIEPQALTKSITVNAPRCDPSLVAEADGVKVEQVVLNLLSNAVKFTPSGGRVSVHCDRDGDRVRIRVADTGPGIPSAQQAAIFEPFVQLGRSLTSRHEGTGLGLAISRDLARAMAGDLSVESTVGVGSTFTLLLPALAS
jgi:PAS domain S-box-containing protein